MPTGPEKYLKEFGIEPACLPVRQKALELALDIRKFEISLYWQRATYFWALIAAAFAGYFAILAASNMYDAAFNAFTVSCIGFIFSLAWFLANRGSKFWQENWELHVDMLEDAVSGPLYKTVLLKPHSGNLVERLVDGPLPISVSRVNQWVSLFTLFVWLALAANVLEPFSMLAPISWRHVIVAVITGVVSGAMFRLTGSKLGGERTLSVITRTATIRRAGVNTSR